MTHTASHPVVSRLPDQPRVSVIMPVYRPDLSYFRQAVRSILGQSCDFWELIVVEKPSGVPVAPVLAGYCDARIRYVEARPDALLTDQRNIGLSMARADLIAMMDADDVADPQRLHKQVEYLCRHPQIDVLNTHIRVIDAQGKPLGYRLFPVGNQAIIRSLARLNVISQPGVMFRRQAVIDAGGYRYSGYQGVEDYELWCRLARSGLVFETYPQALLDYRIHKRQIKYVALRDTIRGTLQVKTLYWKDQDTMPGRLRRLLEGLLLCAPPGLVFWLCTQLRYRRHRRLPLPEEGVTAV